MMRLFVRNLQVAQALDDSMSPEVQNHLFQEPGKQFGLDLAALNIQRGREHGIPSYNKYREWCGLPPIRSFDDLLGYMSNRVSESGHAQMTLNRISFLFQTVSAYSRTYASPEDIDLWSAGISETPLPGSMVGPTFACLIGKQFHNFR